MPTTTITMNGVTTSQMTLNGRDADGIATDLDQVGGNPGDLVYADDVRTYVNDAIAEITGSIGGGGDTSSGEASVTNYVSKAASSTLTMRGSLMEAPQVALTQQLGHVSEGPYDAAAGYLTSTYQTAPTSKLHKAVTAKGALADRVAIFQQSAGGTTTTELARLRYQFHRVRQIDTVHLRIDHADASSDITALIIVINGTSYELTTELVGNSGNTYSVDYVIPDGPVAADSVRINISSISVAGSYAIGFGFTFADTGSSDAVILAGTEMIVPASNDTTTKYATVAPIPIDATGIVEDHWHVIGLDIDTADIEFHPIVPIFADNTTTMVHPLANPLNHTPYYGSLVLGGSAVIYTPSNPNDLYLDADYYGGSDLTLTQGFPNEAALEGMSFSVTTTNVVGAVNSVNLPSTTTVSVTVTLADTSEVVFDTEGAGDYALEISEEINESSLIGAVSAMRVEADMGVLTQKATNIVIAVTSSGGDVAVQNLSIAMNSLRYNTLAKAWEDNLSRILMGWIYKDSVTGVVSYRAPAVNFKAQLSPGGYNAGSFMVEHVDMNPFFHTNIEVDGNNHVAAITVYPESVKSLVTDTGKPVISVYPQTTF